MRPLHLSIRAFGPYAEQQVFDFQLLGERNLFLITGDIGAGKTTVFDAICCALYGETSGGERTVEDMRSHHAQPETSTEITLDFSIQGALYRACFSPRQQIPKKRGEGFTEQSVQSALYQIDFVEQSNEQATLLSESIRNTRPEVEALIGFNVNQFRQVVMLAQGKFRELLTANSSDREEILKTLVDTEFLSRFERKLKTLEAELKQKVTELESQIKGLLKTENVDSIEDLRPQQLEIKQQQSQVDKEIVVAESTRLKAENDLNQAIAMNKLFVLHQSLLLAQQNLLAQKATFDTLALSLETHTKAEKLWPDYRLYEDANKALCLLNVTLKQAKETLTNCSQLATKTADELKYMEADEKVQQQRKLELHELKQTNEALALLSVNRIKHQQTVDLFSRSEQLVLHAEKKLKTDLQQLESNDIALNKLSHCETQSLETEHLLLQNKQLLKQLNRIKETEKKQIKIEAIANKLQQQFIQQNAVVESVEQSLQQLESDRLQDMASHLAIQLKHDAPCSVCGSDHHPAPATPPPHIPSNQQIDDSKQQLKIEQQKRLELQQQSDEQHCLLAGTLSALVELRHSLSTETASIDSCIKQSTTLEQQLESINIQLKQKQALQQDQNKLRLSLKQADDDRGNLQSQLKEHHSEMISLEGQIKSQLNNIPTQFHNKTELNQEINLLAQQLAEFDSQFQALSVKNKSAQQQLNTAIGTLSSLEIQHQTLTDDVNSKQELIQFAIAQSIFPDISSLKSARLPELDFINQTKKHQDYQQQTLSIENQLNQLLPQLTGHSPLDLSSLENNYQQAQFSKNECLKQNGQLQQRLIVLDKLFKKVEHEASLLDAATEEYQQTSHLSKIANGTGYQGSKLSFSRFLLGRLLDEILQAASSRLDIMSEGRYQLIRKLDQSNRQSAFGLDIELIDAYTGQKRAVNTFSGGEGFLASLAIALGLSEVVQNNAGGIHLDTLFIDEGFGSLNDEALEQAINVLTTLSGNGRLVAVISHVGELKERIDAQLIISKTSKGSSAKFVM